MNSYQQREVDDLKEAQDYQNSQAINLQMEQSNFSLAPTPQLRSKVISSQNNQMSPQQLQNMIERSISEDLENTEQQSDSQPITRMKKAITLEELEEDDEYQVRIKEVKRLNKSDVEKLHSAAFNQDFSCFCITTNYGFKVFSSSPLRQVSSSYTYPLVAPSKTEEKRCSTHLSLAQMLFRTNFLAFVSDCRALEQRVVVWDDAQKQGLAEVNFQGKVQHIFLKSDKLLVLLKTNVVLLHLSTLKIAWTQTLNTKEGYAACAMNSTPECTVIAFPDAKVPHNVKVLMFDSKGDTNASIKPVRESTILAHKSRVQYLQLNASGTMIATSSLKGTVIRVFDTQSGQCLQHFRRGNSYAQITCLAFCQIAPFLACASNSGTVHIFVVKAMQTIDSQNNSNFYPCLQAKNNKTFLSNEELSFAQVHTPKNVNLQVGFSNDYPGRIYIVDSDAHFQQATFSTEDGGEAVVEITDELFKQNGAKQF